MGEDAGSGLGIDGRELLVPGALVASLLVLSYRFLGFLLDDAYITFRYGKHLAEGHGLVWNVGQDPVEGATSLLWALLSSVPHLVGLPVADTMVAVSLASAGTSIVVVYLVARRMGATPWVAGAGSATMGTSPAFAFIALQGMETALSGLLALGASVAAIRYARTGSHASAGALVAASFLAGTARPGLALFGATLLAGLALQLYRADRSHRCRRLVAWTGAGYLLPGLAYMGLRYAYFGSLFPNPFYVKSDHGLAGTLLGGELVFTFVFVVLGALLVAVLWRLADPDPGLRGRLELLAPVLAACSLFLAIGFVVRPMQAYLWRFQMPVLPSLVLAGAVLIRSFPVSPGRALAGASGWARPRPLGALLLAATLVLAPLSPYTEVADQYRNRYQGDREAAGKALTHLADEEPRMFVTESGALPYFSEWTAVDWLGLNNETIAHEGMSVELLEDYDPDLVMLLVRLHPGHQKAHRPHVVTYLQEQDYQLAAAINKSLTHERFHVYFVDPDSPVARETACSLLTLDSVGYTDREEALARMNLESLAVVPETAGSCRATDAGG